MERMHAVVSDADLPEVFFGLHHALEDDYWPGALGFHDAETVAPHIHWSILTVVDGVVVDWDWGYHSQTEARSYILRDNEHLNYDLERRPGPNTDAMNGGAKDR